LSEGVTKALIADVVPKQQRAGAIGLFYTVSGVGQLVASVVAGSLWNVRLFNGSLMASFLFGAVCAALAVPLIATVRITPAKQMTAVPT